MIQPRHLRAGMAAGAALLVLAAAAPVNASTTVVVKRCGYTNAQYGRSAIYPWHMSCAQARSVIAASDNPHTATVNFGAGWDGAAVAIHGKFWVCTGQMGYYGCAYPWHPIAVDNQVGYAKPFTKGVFYETCSSAGRGSCGPTAPFAQPPSI